LSGSWKKRRKSLSPKSKVKNWTMKISNVSVNQWEIERERKVSPNCVENPSWFIVLFHNPSLTTWYIEIFFLSLSLSMILPLWFHITQSSSMSVPSLYILFLNSLRDSNSTRRDSWNLKISEFPHCTLTRYNCVLDSFLHI
jgi:hypothetical protein